LAILQIAYQQMNLLLIILSILGWAFWSFTNRLASQKMDPFMMMIMGMVCNFVVVPVYLTQVKSFKLDGMGWVLLSSIAVCIGALAYTFLAMRLGVSSAVSYTAMYPLISFFLAVIFLHENFSVWKCVGLALMVIGTIFVSR
jgi:drug/metabolite transporter (DMT)-like permease